MIKRAGLMLLFMLCAAVAAYLLKPTHKLADTAPAIDLEQLIPLQFDGWKEDPGPTLLIANPQQIALLNKLYNQTLSRSYVDQQGYRIMLSIAYGGDQSDSLQLHKPEVCYPAQGFELMAKTDASIQIESRTIPVVRLDVRQAERLEKVTYWTTVGDQIVQGKVQKKLVEMSYGLSGKIPDGILFRVSSLDGDNERAYARQTEFVRALMSAVTPATRARLIGG
jgi:EpsI family protein